MLAGRPSDLILGNVFISIPFRSLGLSVDMDVHLKLEGYSLGTSIKTKTALHMIERLELAGRLWAGSRLIESSSGNLGLALSAIAAERGYHFTCVSDPNLSLQTDKLMRAYGAEVVIVNRLDGNGGYLGARIEYIASRLKQDHDLIWLNQYANEDNPGAHERFTGPEIVRQFARPDYVFVGTGTTGTLTGVSRYLRKVSPATRIVAVDTIGSVTFGGKPGQRHVPGLGTSRRPEIADEAVMDELVYVSEFDTVAMCRRLAARGLLVGGSTGAVLAAIANFGQRIAPGSCIVALSPDLGDHYVDTIYDDDWVRERFPGLLEGIRSFEPV
ncbi:2,3-diaminopropionate biosynthesis protein SbnA [Bradyrhizobium sp. GM5.1]